MPNFDVEIAFPADMTTVVRTNAATKREAEIAAIATVKARPSAEYKWKIIRPSEPEYLAEAVKTGPSNGTEVSTITEETTTVQNPVRRAGKNVEQYMAAAALKCARAHCGLRGVRGLVAVRVTGTPGRGGLFQCYQSVPGGQTSRGPNIYVDSDENTSVQNPSGRQLKWWAGFPGWLDCGPYSTREQAIAAFRKKHGFDPPSVEQHELKMAPKRSKQRTKLVSSTNSKAAEKTIRSAATLQFGRGKTDLVYEHGQWFATVKTRRGDDLYSVVDVHPNQIGFELIERHEY